MMDQIDNIEEKLMKREKILKKLRELNNGKANGAMDLFFNNNHIAIMTTPNTTAIHNPIIRNKDIGDLRYSSLNSPAKALLIACRISSASVSPCPSAVQEQTNS